MLEGMTLRKAVEFAATTERLGAETYNRLAKKFEGDAEVHQVFKQLAAEEVDHEKDFRELLEKLPESPEPRDYAEKYGYLRAMSISEFFNPRDGIARSVEAIATRDDAIRRGIELEKATLGFYLALGEVMGPHDILARIIQTERNHLMKLVRLLSPEA